MPATGKYTKYSKDYPGISVYPKNGKVFIAWKVGSLPRKAEMIGLVREPGIGRIISRKVEEKWQEIRNYLSYGDLPDWSKPKNPTFVDIAEFFRAENKIIPSHYNILTEHFNKQEAEQITIKDCKDFISKLSEQYSGSHVNKVLLLARRIYLNAMDAELVSKNPFAVVKGKVETARKQTLAYEDYLNLIELLPDYLKVSTTMCYFLGLRKSEFTNNDWSNVHLNAPIPYIHIPKRLAKTEGSVRDVPLTSNLVDALMEYTKGARHITGKIVPVNRFDGAWNTACNQLGLAIQFRDLRRTAVSNMVASGIDKAIRCKITGHKSGDIHTDVYTQVNLETMLDAIKEVELNLSNSVQVKRKASS